jgi:hypothetical protein
MNITNTFAKVFQAGLDAASLITDQKDKGLVYAELAKALAATGLVTEKDTAVTENDKETKKETAKETKKTNNSKKDSLKADAAKAQAPKEEKEETPTAPVETETEGEVEIAEEWTDDMVTLKTESLERLNAYAETWGEDYVYNQCVPAFFEDQTVVGKDNIRPTNIDGFVSYLDQLAEQFASEEQ